jgi:excisionase family DNA binding protein
MTGSYVPPEDDLALRLVPFPQRDGREPWWPKKRLAEYFGVSERTIERWTAEGMPCLRGPRTVRYRPSAVEAWLEAVRQ